MLKVSIPKPCHEDWNKMTSNQQGRHCSSCAKTVIDFTSMSDEEVKNFLINKAEERICGRFKTEQLHRITINLPENIFQMHMPLWKRFLAASLIIFSTTLFSCNTNLTSNTQPITDTTKITPQDTLSDIMMGKPMAGDTTSTKNNTSGKAKYNIEPGKIIPIENENVMGELYTGPVDTIKSVPKKTSSKCDTTNAGIEPVMGIVALPEPTLDKGQ